MRVLFFAHLCDVTGCAERDFSLTASVDPEGFWQMLLAAYQGLAVHRRTVRLARNLEYVGPGALFAETDEVALIPPVSGG